MLHLALETEEATVFETAKLLVGVLIAERAMRLALAVEAVTPLKTIERCFDPRSQRN